MENDDLSIGDADNVNRYNAQFVRWAGDLEGLDVDVTSATITFVVDRPHRIAPIYSEQWLLYQTGGEWRIKNSVWDLAVEKYGTKKQIEAREKCMAQRARRT